MKPGEPVSVLWVDSASKVGWQDAGDHLGPVKIETIGFLVHKNKTQVQVALSRAIENSGAEYADVIAIPTGCIRNMRKI